MQWYTFLSSGSGSSELAITAAKVGAYSSVLSKAFRSCISTPQKWGRVLALLTPSPITSLTEASSFSMNMFRWTRNVERLPISCILPYGSFRLSNLRPLTQVKYWQFIWSLKSAMSNPLSLFSFLFCFGVTPGSSCLLIPLRFADSEQSGYDDMCSRGDVK